MRRWRTGMMILAFAPLLLAQERGRERLDQDTQKDAIRFEKAKQDAADRQERRDAEDQKEPQRKAQTFHRKDARTKQHRDGTTRKDVTEKNGSER